ncbi:MAG: insulinase family protein [Bdellovibrionales bacterium]|nr:insulinase family protein [Bdellovibrionales bacterium]
MLKRYTLKNGIPLFVVESASAPVVSIQAWVARGSTHESAKLAGISHFLEHALFKGTKKRKVGEIALEIERCGGEVNAFTSFEETVYYATLASRYFEEGFDVITDAVQNPSFDAREMEREKEVILEEIKRAHDSATKTVFMNLWALAFSGTQYGRPVLGYDSTVSKINAKSLRQYHHDNYHTGSVSLFVVGDVDADKVFDLAQKKMARMRKPKSKPLVPKFHLPKLPTIPVSTASRDIKECHAYVGFRTPAISDSLIPALDLFCSAIGQGESSRMYQKLVKTDRIALDADMGLVATNSCGIATIGLSTAPEKLYDATRAAYDVLEEVAREGAKPEEIDRVKSAMESEIIYGKQTVEGYAKRLGYYHRHFGDPEFEKRYLDMIMGVKAEDLQTALKIVTREKPVISLVHPQGFELDKKKLVGLYQRPKVNPVTKSDTGIACEKEAGITFITKRSSELPVRSLRLIFLGGGSREEEKDNLGISNLFQSLWTSGTKSYSSLDLAHTLESLGASISSFAGKNTCGLSVDFLTKHWHRVKPLLEEVLLEPTFPQEELDTERELTLREILSQRDYPSTVCQLNFLQTLYGDHPYGRSHLGTEETVKSFTRETLSAWYREYVHRGRLVVSTVGDFSHEEWVAELREMCKHLPVSGKESKSLIPVRRPNQLQVITAEKQPLFQSHVLIGFLGARLDDEERFALRVLSSCLAGQGGRLFLELRDKLSLAYTVAPMNSESIEAGAFAFYIGCSPEKLERAITGIRNEIDKILTKPLGAKELERAKQYLVGRFELDMQRNSAQAMLFGLDEIYGIGYDHALRYPAKIRAVTAKGVQAAAQKFLTPETAVLSVVHPTPIDEAFVRRAWDQKGPGTSANRPRKGLAELSA